MECQICIEPYNLSTRKKIICNFCNFEQCCKCFRRYLLTSEKIAPDCMNCNHELNLDFIAEATPKIFHNVEYRNRRSQILLSQERSLLPDSQILVERHKQAIKNKELIKNHKNTIIELKNRIRILSREIYALNNINYDNYDDKKERKKFIFPCPAEGCRGFLSQAWKCGTCETKACSKCGSIKTDDNHVCNEDELKSFTKLREETRPCPKCAVPIYKISGCDQMWCVECNTPFSWNKGTIISGVIHNPHFYEWQRSNNGGVAPRVPGDNPFANTCGRLPSINTIERILTLRGAKEDKRWEKCHRLILHVQDVTIRHYPNQVGIRDNADLRVKFLLNQIDEKTWLKNLKMREKKIEKDRYIHNILELFYVSGTDIFNTYINAQTDTLYEALKSLRNYVNQELYKVKNRLNCRTPYISTTWDIKWV